MAKIEWAGIERNVDCTDAELTEMFAEANDDVVFIGVWLDAMFEVEFDEAMMIARDYRKMLMES